MFCKEGGESPFVALGTNGRTAQKAEFAKSCITGAVFDMLGPELHNADLKAYVTIHMLFVSGPANNNP